ncbi:YpoC family protein [Sporosarcina soli]|uniref:YpoC family protein n=1 Tax=Sporosarcina soli TaxID=334736 RepID=A0ABW0TH15_9BACL
MISEMKPIDKELFSPYFEKWEAIRETIELFYTQKDRQALEMMGEAILAFDELLERGGKMLDERKGKWVYTLEPLNGEERLAFVKAKISSHYAFVQLDALYTETKKKVARLSIMKN